VYTRLKIRHAARLVFNTSLSVLAVFSFGLDVVIMILFALPRAVFHKFRLLVFAVQVFFLSCILAEPSDLRSRIVYSRKTLILFFLPAPSQCLRSLWSCVNHQEWIVCPNVQLFRCQRAELGRSLEY